MPQRYYICKVTIAPIMRKTALLLGLFLTVAVTPVSCKKINLEKSKEKARNEYLIKKSTEVIINLAPGYLKADKPVISDIQEHEGQKFYTVTYPCNDVERASSWNYSTKVDIWADNGEPKDLKFGGRMEYVSFESQAYSDLLKKYKGRMEEIQTRYPKEQLEDNQQLMSLESIVFSGRKDLKAGDVITGTVLDSDGKPLSTANVTERDSNDRIVAHSVTDQEGAFAFRLVNPANHIEVSYVGFQTASSEIKGSSVRIVMTGMLPVE